MFDKVKRIQKVKETCKFVDSVQNELIKQKNIAWKNKIAEYVRSNTKSPYVGTTVISLWCTLSETLRLECYYRESVLVGELAVLHSENLKEEFCDIRIKALLSLGTAQVECMQLEKGINTLERAYAMLKPGIHSYESLQVSSGMILSYAYTKGGRYEESSKILKLLLKWIAEHKPSNISQDDIFLLNLSQGNNLLMQGKYQEGLQLAEKLKRDAERFHMQNEPIYYKTLFLQGCYEKMMNHVERYYELTKQAMELAKKAGDIQETSAYRANLIDALMRLGKDEEVLLQAYGILAELDENGGGIESLNILQSYMNILLGFAQDSKMLDDMDEMIDKARASWEKVKKWGADCNSRDAIKIQAQFGTLMLFQKKYIEAEKLLCDCLKQSQKVSGENDIDTLSIREALAKSKRMQGDYNGALASYLEIERLRIDSGQGNYYSYCQTLRSIAYMYYFTGEKQEAIKRILSYFHNVDKYSYEVFRVFDEAAWKKFSYEFLRTLHDVLGWLAASPEKIGKIEEIYEIVLRFKNRIYDEEMLWKTRKKSADVYPLLAEYYSILNVTEKSQNLEEKLELLNRRKYLENEISKWRPEFLNPAPALEKLKMNLNTEDAILDYVVCYEDPGYEETERRTQGYLLFVITRDKVRFYDLGSKKILDDDMKEFYDVVSSYECNDMLLEQQLTLLKAGLGFFHMAKELGSIKRVYLGLDGEIMPSQPWDYILSDYEVQVLPSFISFGETAPLERNEKGDSREIDFFSNPDISLNKEKKYKAEISLLIVKTTKALLADLPKVNLHAYEGKYASRQKLIMTESPDILHIAAHGNFVREGNKFQRSTIQLSGKDGALTMLDVMQMELFSTQLVILDACESGIGDFQEDEGVYGFARAFFIAGAEGVLTCLWKVDALFSVVFLDCFYRNYFISGRAEDALYCSRNLVRSMTKANLLVWLACRRSSIEEMDDGAQAYKILENTIEKFNDSGAVFDKPVYWACFELSRPVRTLI